ncbi:MAG: D-alanyl-D-alanine carboxypeptidase/D-alanyl-D-alanine-endopeptidase [Methanobacteriaceae archaeon]|nr:D-alanyl-D-alanine carboxypeptidase/D-alanyl-D-alanine-endopeptidase [Methanobacteriaceae archaeon]
MSDVYEGLGIIIIIILGCMAVFISMGDSTEVVSDSVIDIKGSPFNDSKYVHASWGMLIQDMASGETIFDLNSKNMFVPGSTAKLFITSAAMDAYGPDYIFQTPVYAEGDITNGTLNGDLVLVASGDLTMGGRNTPDGKIEFSNLDHGDADAIDGATLTKKDPLSGLNELARQVKESGIERVEGDVIIDDSLFNTTNSSTGDYVITPIMINDNLIDVEVTPGQAGEDAVVNWRPQNGSYQVVSRVKTIASNETDIEINYTGNGSITVDGYISANSDPLLKTYTVKDPASFARVLFIEALEREGVEVTSPKNITNQELFNNTNASYNDSQQVALLKSLPFSENIKLIMKVSQNIHADTLVSLMAAKNNNTTFEEGLSYEGAFLNKAGLSNNSVFLSDGRGGDSSDRISPQAANQLLKYISNQDYFQEYFNSLPVMGKDGSLAGVVAPESNIYGKINAKTGTTISGDMAHQSLVLLSKGMSGYMTTKSGRKLIFSIYVNNVPIGGVEDTTLVLKDMASVMEKIYEEY